MEGVFVLVYVPVVRQGQRKAPRRVGTTNSLSLRGLRRASEGNRTLISGLGSPRNDHYTTLASASTLSAPEGPVNIGHCVGVEGFHSLSFTKKRICASSSAM